MSYVFFEGGVVAIQATPQAFAAVGNFAKQIADDVADQWDNTQDAQALADVFKNSLSGNGLDTVKVIGAAAFGGLAVAPLTALFGGAAGATVLVVGGGWVAGLLYEAAFDAGVGIGGRAGTALYDILDPGSSDTRGGTGGDKGGGAGGPDGGKGAPGGPGDGGRDSGNNGTTPPRRDPLVLDLDGDGIETTSTRDGTVILFDHDADGVKTGTGWVKPDDGWLVRDRNGNGTIDSGRELFGVDTLKSNGQLATDGFDALKDLDANKDGKIDAADSVFASLRIWRDLNQDGISQANELTTLSANSITGIGVNSSAVRTDLGNGNFQTAAGTFTRSNGTTGATGETNGAAANLDLLVNTFYRTFTTQITLTDQAKALPDLRGSGRVRDLSEAISLSTDLGNWVQTYTQQTTRQGQLDKLDGFIERWANTADLKSLKAQADALKASGVKLTYYLEGLTAGTPAYDDFVRKLGVVERFMGFTYGGVNGQARLTPLDPTSGNLIVSLGVEQIANISLAYDRFKTDIYESLLLQTRLSTYFSKLDIAMVDGQIVLDFQPLENAFKQAIAMSPRDGIIDLVEFLSAAGEIRLKNLNWNATDFLVTQLNAAPDLGAFTKELSGWTVRFAGANERDLRGTSRPDLLVGTETDDMVLANDGNDILVGRIGNDALYGDAGNDFLSGGEGNDSLYGGSGADILDGGAGKDFITGEAGNDAMSGGADNDTLYGGDGDDTLNGGTGDDFLSGERGNNNLVGAAGNDTLYAGDGSDLLNGGMGDDVLMGGAGSDTYLFGRGDGRDLIAESGSGNLIRFANNISPNDVLLKRSDSDLIVSIDGTTDAITVSMFFGGADSSGVPFPIQSIVFSNGVIWDSIALKDRLLVPTSGDDRILGSVVDDVINGIEGDDGLSGYAGDDTIDGGAGNDWMAGGLGNDVFLFGKGDGQDTIDEDWNIDPNHGKLNVLQFKAGVLPEEVKLSRSHDRLHLSIVNTSDKISVVGFFNEWEWSDWIDYEPLQLVKFSNGVTWNVATINSKVIAGDSSSQRIWGYETSDTLEALGGDDWVWGEAGDDVIDGGIGNDVLSGGTGNDTLAGGLGDDYLNGGGGNDTYLIEKGEGVDHIQIYNNDEYDEYGYRASGGVDILQFGAGILPSEVTVSSYYRDRTSLLLSFKNSNDQVIVDKFFAGSSSLELVKFSNGVVWDVATIKMLALLGDSSSQYLMGSNAADTISALGGNDTLYGEGGDDLLDGGAGSDTLFGGAGNDIYLFARGDGADAILDSDADNNEFDTLQFKNGIGPNDVRVAQSGHDLFISIASNDSFDQIWVPWYFGGPSWSGSTPTPIDLIKFSNGIGWDIATVRNLVLAPIFEGTQGTDSLTGSTSDDKMRGLDGDDTLAGLDGDDELDGGAGADALQGGAGNDTYVVDNAGDVVTEAVNGGTDTVKASVSHTLGGNVENLTLTGSSAINATGNALNNVLIGNSAANILDGAAGADSISGGAGNDIYVVDNVGDVVIEAVNEGTDTVQASVSYSLGAHVENLTLTGAGVINATGNALNNVLTGNSAANVLDGGAGADTLVGGAGNDTFVVDNAGDVVTEAANAGTDTVQASVSHTLGANLENLTLTGSASINATGNTLNNVLTGNSAANVLDGGAGADTLSGGLGNDSYVIDNAGDVVIEAANSGTDTVLSSVSHTLGLNVENLTLIGAALINATGNTLNNALTGNSAGNVLDGGAGADTLNGGAGNDTYLVDNVGDVVNEVVNDGIDAVQASISFALGDHIENLTLVGAASINATGNSLNNVLTGNSAANVLDGGAGADTMSGGLGNDTYLVDNPGDLVNELTNAGTDAVQSSVSYTLGMNVENLILTGSANVNATGNTLNNVLTGNVAANLINGGAGADSMSGGAGDDTYLVDNAGDVVIEAANAGIDTVQASVSYALGANVENLTLTGSAGISATGNALNNVIVGNSGANSLAGGAGDDRLDGGAGNDRLNGDTGNDIYVVDSVGDVVTEAANAGTDTVQTSVSYTLGNNVENLTLTGSAAIHATGNGLDNVLIGNSASNRINGGVGADTLYGGSGNDTLWGGLGSDILFGESGSDVFVFDTSVGVSIDIISDFEVNADKIQLDDDIFKALGVVGTASGVALQATRFQLGASANDSADRIIYNQSTGQLFYDADGNGAAAQQQIALIGVSTHAALTASHFLVIA